MTRCKQISFSFFLLLFFVTYEAVADVCSDDELYVIRSSGSGGVLVLDGGEPPKVTIQYYTGFSPQMWQFKRGSKAGFYYIINNHTGDPLDGSDDLVMSDRKEALEQQWSLTLNGRIVNAVNHRYVEVDERYSSGNGVTVAEDTGRKSQQFSWEVLTVRPNTDWCKYLLRK